MKPILHSIHLIVHGMLIKYQHCMPIFYHHHGKYDKAAAVRTGARERVLQAEHRGTASSLNNLLTPGLPSGTTPFLDDLAGLYSRQGWHDKAETLYKRGCQSNIYTVPRLVGWAYGVRRAQFGRPRELINV
ncbi:hypothetical protein BC936DRAFT_145811 [Jimgerdemannia flammicorona]|uniref:Uncharacterized protein n=1 Tax=Jimgerdemannia flammicorona TaxID=994334 RepID=A0A433D921_9FUNG|nr:hypothetical protein BC936DRAFT_145811 [Jimgerdemannia flammicorona]